MNPAEDILQTGDTFMTQTEAQHAAENIHDQNTQSSPSLIHTPHELQKLLTTNVKTAAGPNDPKVPPRTRTFRNMFN